MTHHELRDDRFFYTKDTTIGRLYINDVFFCYTLEDTVRGWGIKVPGHTAIPGNRKDRLYNVGITMSGRFGREMVVLYTQPHDPPYMIISGGIVFKGIRAHGGADHHDTEGCPIVAYNWDGAGKVWGSAEADLTAKVLELLKECKVKWYVRNLKQQA